MRAFSKKSVDQWEVVAKNNNVSIVLHNYPGYGDTSGPVTIELLAQDSIQLIRKIMAENWAQGKELVLMGNSIGLFTLSFRSRLCVLTSELCRMRTHNVAGDTTRAVG